MKANCRGALGCHWRAVPVPRVVQTEMDFRSYGLMCCSAKRAASWESNDSTLMTGQVPVPQQVCPERLSPRGLELCCVA